MKQVLIMYWILWEYLEVEYKFYLRKYENFKELNDFFFP